MKTSGVKIGDNYKLSVDGKVVRDEAKIDSKLDVSTRLQRRKSKRVRVKPVDQFRV